MGNRLSAVPDWIGELTTLEHLDLGVNGLSEVPGAIRGLRNLTSLFLAGNELSVLPAWIAELTRLTVLNLNDNPWVSPPPGVVAAGTEAVLAYLRG